MTITANYLAWKDDQTGYEAALSPDQGDSSDNTAKEMILRGLIEECYTLRKSEYPSAGDLGDAIYHQSQGDDTKMTAYNTKVKAVKDKYPLPPVPSSYGWEQTAMEPDHGE